MFIYFPFFVIVHILTLNFKKTRIPSLHLSSFSPDHVQSVQLVQIKSPTFLSSSPFYKRLFTESAWTTTSQRDFNVATELVTNSPSLNVPNLLHGDQSLSKPEIPHQPSIEHLFPRTIFSSCAVAILYGRFRFGVRFSEPLCLFICLWERNKCKIYGW